MHPNCGLCRMDLVMIQRPGLCVHICPRCDTVNQGGGRRVGPPSMPGTTNGWFNAPFGDKT